MESDDVALSTAMRDLIPLKAAVSEIISGMGPKDEKIVTIKSTIWEDNMGALTLANMGLPRTTPLHSMHQAICDTIPLVSLFPQSRWRRWIRSGQGSIGRSDGGHPDESLARGKLLEETPPRDGLAVRRIAG
jgi:hypothetical protein